MLNITMSELNKAQAQPSSPSSFLERLCCPSKENPNLNNMFKEIHHKLNL